MMPRLGELSPEAIRLVEETISESAVFCTQGSCLLDRDGRAATQVLGNDEAEKVLEGKVRNSMTMAKRRDASIVMWAPQGPLVDAFMQRVAKASDQAKTLGKIYLVTSIPNSLAGANSQDLRYLWESPFISGRWKMMVPCTLR